MDKIYLLDFTKESFVNINKSYESLLKELEEEEIHDFRVAIRKLFPIIALVSFILESQHRENEKLLEVQSELKKYFKSFSELRDVQVQSSYAKEYDIESDYIENLNSREKTLIDDLKESIKSWSIDKDENDFLLLSEEILKDLKAEGLNIYSDRLEEKLKKKVLKKIKKLDESSRSYHKLRISIKKYRYLMDLLDSSGEAGEKLKIYQDKLGKIQDLSVLLKDYEKHSSCSKKRMKAIKKDIDDKTAEFFKKDSKKLKRLIKKS